MLEAMRLVRAIAKRLVGGVAAAAKCDDFTATEVIGIPSRVEQFDVSMYFDGAVVVDGNLCFFHDEFYCLWPPSR